MSQAQTRTQAGKHLDTLFYITIEKTDIGYYRATVQVNFSGQKPEIVTLNDTLPIDLSTMKKSAPGESWEKNPYHHVLDYTRSFIEGRLAAGKKINPELEKIIESVPSYVIAALTGIDKDDIDSGNISGDDMVKIKHLPQVKAILHDSE